jgi:hypothetical protein
MLRFGPCVRRCFERYREALDDGVLVEGTVESIASG